jgi:hypothetical protein
MNSVRNPIMLGNSRTTLSDKGYFRAQRKHEVYCRGEFLRISLNARHADGTAVSLRACGLSGPKGQRSETCEDLVLPLAALSSLEALAAWASASPGTDWLIRLKLLPEFRIIALTWFENDPQLPYTRADLSTGSVWLRAALPDSFGIHRHGLNPDLTPKVIA